MRLKCNNSIEPAVIVRFMCFNEKKRHPNDETLYNITCLFISQGLSRIVYDSCFFERTDVVTGFELFNRLQLMHVLNSICLDFNWKNAFSPQVEMNPKTLFESLAQNNDFHFSVLSFVCLQMFCVFNQVEIFGDWTTVKQLLLWLSKKTNQYRISCMRNHEKTHTNNTARYFVWHLVIRWESAQIRNSFLNVPIGT